MILRRLLLSMSVLLLLAACSGERRVIKSPLAPRGLELLEAGLDPATPLAFERAIAWALLRDAESASVFVAHVDSVRVSQEGFVLSPELFLESALEAQDQADGRGLRRFELELPPRPSGTVLYYWFEAYDGMGNSQRLPASAPEGAIPVGTRRFVIDFEWPGWSEPFGGLECWADLDLYDSEFGFGGPNFDEVVAPIWVPKDHATIFASSIGLQDGVGVIVNGQPYFYPLNIMLWNEVANAQQEGTQTVLSYCPLTDTALFFAHQNIEKFRNWEVAGLFNSNVMVGDPTVPRSLVPQMLAFGVSGSRAGVCAEIMPSFLCRRGFWEALHPDTLVLDGDSSLAGDWNWLGMHNPYFQYWRQHSDIRAPLAHPDLEHPLGLNNKDLVVGVIGNGDPTIYPLHRSVPGGVLVYNDDEGARPMLLLWVESARFAAVFDRRHPVSGEQLDFRLAATSFNGVPLMEDRSVEPSLWTPDGLAISGPHAGTQLAWLPSMRAFWFAWHTIYPHSRMVDLPTAGEG